MDPFFTTLIAAVIAFPVLAIVGFVMTLGNRERLKRLEFRLARNRSKACRACWRSACDRPCSSCARALGASPRRGARGEGRGKGASSAGARDAGCSAYRAKTCKAQGKPRRALRHAMGRLGRRHRARAWRLLPGAPGNRAGLVRARRPRPARCHRRACSDRRRRMDQAARDQNGARRPSQGAYSERAHRGRHGHRLCRRLCSLRALPLHRPGPRFHSARRRRARHARRGAAARPCTRGARSDRRFRHAAHRLDRDAQLSRALSLSRRGDGRRLRACSRAAVALARDCRGGCERAVDFAGNRRVGLATGACLSCRDRLRLEFASHRLGFPVRATVRAWRDRSRLIGRARRLSLRRDAARARDRA